MTIIQLLKYCKIIFVLKVIVAKKSFHTHKLLKCVPHIKNFSSELFNRKKC